jgi:SAM-dependent methyltransferase
MLMAAHAATDQDQVNRYVYGAPSAVRHYRSSTLDAAETIALLLYQPAIAGQRVLDLGVGTGRTTSVLAALASHYVGLEFSPHMIDAFRRHHAGAEVLLGDMRDLSRFDVGSFDFVFASCNLVDAVSHTDRLRVFAEVRRVLRPRGLFMFSSHNRRFREALSGPILRWSRNPGTQVLHAWRYARSLVNHARVRHLRHVENGHAILNDPGHDYAALHYYVERETARAQMEFSGFHVLREFDLSGRTLEPDSDDRETSSVLYVAERGASEAPADHQKLVTGAS